MEKTLVTTGFDSLATLVAEARETISDARAATTVANQRLGFRDFAEWCADVGLAPLPAHPATVVLFLTRRAHSLKTSTVLLRLYAISAEHRAAGVPDPAHDATVRSFVQGLARRAAANGVRTRKMAALRTPELRKAVVALPNTLLGKRDRALLLLGFAAALRRSELVALDVADIALDENGAVVTIRRGKTDQEGAGADVSVPFGQNSATCPVRALQAWCAASGIESGAIFRRLDRYGRIHDRLTAHAVLRIVRRSVERVGLDADDFGSHSMRRGFATSAAAAGVSERVLAKHGRWKSHETMRGYIEDGTRWAENAAGAVGL